MEDIEENYLGILLKERLKDNSLSMRKLSRNTGIDPSVISKIVNGKRKANINHLMAFSKHLQIPMSTLLTVAGYEDSEDKRKATPKIEESASHIDSLLKTFGIDDTEFSMDKLEQELKKYQDYYETAAGKKAIKNQFKEKLDQIGNKVENINQLQTFFDAVIHRKGTAKQLLLMGSALLYFISTVDLVPDYVFSVGFLDDMLAVQYTYHLLTPKE